MSLNVYTTNRDYIDQLYQQYQADPSSVDDEWRIFFQGFELGYGRSEAVDVVMRARRRHILHAAARGDEGILEERELPCPLQHGVA